MPLELETKFVMAREMAPEWLASLTGVQYLETMTIEQVYDAGGGRFRRTTPLKSNVPEYHFAYKKDVDGLPIEIEQRIDARDFEALCKATTRIVHKTRYLFSHQGTGLFFELDVYDHMTLNRDGVMLQVMEVEYDEGEEHKLELVEDLIRQNLVLRVKAGDKRFSNVKLSDRYYALGLAEETYLNHAEQHRKAA